MKVGCYDCGKTDVKLVERPRSVKSGYNNTVDVCIDCRDKWLKKHNMLLKRYNFTCPNCMFEQSAAPSLFMNMGYNSGCGSCFNCDVFLHLEITPDINGTMIKALLWGDYLDKKIIEVDT